MAEANAVGVPLVAKLERPHALEHLDEIIEACDAVMVARGDLGLEMPLERVPRAQKDITRAARRAGIPVIVATQVLESMTVEPRPTRAEVNDAANAVDDGVDAIMLAGETAVGEFPSRAVQTLDAIIRDAESVPLDDRALLAGARPTATTIMSRRCAMRRSRSPTRGDAQAIVAVTRGGSTARRLSVLRPCAPILAATEPGRHGPAPRAALGRGAGVHRCGRPAAGRVADRTTAGDARADCRRRGDRPDQHRP